MRLSNSLLQFGFPVLGLTLMLCAAGCGNPSYEVVKVHGTVTYKGQPLTRGDISFIPVQVEGDTMRRMGVSAINEQGEYVLNSFKPGDGVIPGEYKVIISSRDKASTEASDEEVAARKWYAPKVYSDVATTPLKATISSDSPQPVKLDFSLEGELPN
jgi:hypothetical protein